MSSVSKRFAVPAAALDRAQRLAAERRAREERADDLSMQMPLHDLGNILGASVHEVLVCGLHLALVLADDRDEVQEVHHTHRTHRPVRRRRRCLR